MKVGSFLFGSPVSASAVTNPIFEIKSTEENDKVHSLKNERDQERLSLKECSIFHPLRIGRSLTVELLNPYVGRPVCISIHSRVSKIGG